MADMYKVQVTVKSVKGHCHKEHFEGQQFVCNGSTPAGVCEWAWSAIHPFVATLEFGGTFFWTPDPDAIDRVCPDGVNPVTFEIRRIRE